MNIKKILFFISFVLLFVLLFVACEAETSHEHIWGEWKTTKIANCTTYGEQSRVCGCGMEEIEVLSTTNHNYTEDNYCENCFEMKPGTYTEGLEYYGCSVKSIGTAINETEIIIPAYYDGQKITAISSKAFLGCTKIKSVVLSKTITYIGEGAFSGCYSIESLTMPTIGANKEEFVYNGDNTGLIGYYFGKDSYPNSEKIEQYTLEKKIIGSGTEKVRYTSYIPKSLKTITLIGSDTEELEPSAFSNSNIENVIIKTSVKELDLWCFQNCKKLKNVVIEENCELRSVIGFEGCTSLISVNIPNGVERIGIGAFKNCANLKTVNLPDSLRYISDGGFSNCTSLTDITLPSNLEEISGTDSYILREDGAFYNCKLLKEITLPENLKEIEGYAFYDCFNLKTVYNKSRMAIEKGSDSYGYVAYYATKVVND